MHETIEPRGDQPWAAYLARFAQPVDSMAWRELALTAIPLALLLVAMFWLAGSSYLAALALAPLAGLFLVRLFIIQHDCGHGSFTSSRTLNQWIGFLLGIPTLAPYRYWKRTHAIHHATSGNLDGRELGDIETLTVEEYRALSPMGKLRYRIYRHPLFFVGVGPMLQFLVKHRLPTDIPWKWKKEWADVAWTNLGILVTFLALGWWQGFGRVLMVALPVYWVASSVGVWMFYIQHQFEGTYWAREDSWDFDQAALAGSSFYDLPRVLHWFTLNIGYHHIHHLCTRIPSYRLREVFEAVPELQDVPSLDLRQSFACAGLKLWDEDQQCLVGFEAA